MEKTKKAFPPCLSSSLSPMNKRNKEIARRKGKICTGHQSVRTWGTGRSPIKRRVWPLVVFVGVRKHAGHVLLVA